MTELNPYGFDMSTWKTVGDIIVSLLGLFVVFCAGALILELWKGWGEK